MYACVHTQQSDDQIKRWWIIDGVTFGFETNIYIKKPVSNKPPTWNDVFSCPFLSLSKGTITYHIPILKVAGSRWFSSWSQGRGIGFQWPCCFAEKSGSFFFPHEAVTKPKDWPNWVMMPAVLDQNWPHIKFGCIPIGDSHGTTIFTYTFIFKPIHYPVLYFTILGLFSTFLPSSGQFLERQAVANLGQTAKLNPLWRYGIDEKMMTKLKAFFGNVADVPKWMKWVAELVK